MTAAQSIRQAALSWPLEFLENEELDIVWLYCGPGEYATFEHLMNELQSRIFMLLVAEELDGGAGRYEEMIYRQVDSLFRSLSM